MPDGRSKQASRLRGIHLALASRVMDDRKRKSASAGETRTEFAGQVRDANAIIASGIGIGVLGAATAALSGAACPVCIVAVPALVGAGAYKRWRASRQRRTAGSSLR